MALPCRELMISCGSPPPAGTKRAMLSTGAQSPSLQQSFGYQECAQADVAMTIVPTMEPTQKTIAFMSGSQASVPESSHHARVATTLAFGYSSIILRIPLACRAWETREVAFDLRFRQLRLGRAATRTVPRRHCPIHRASNIRSAPILAAQPRSRGE